MARRTLPIGVAESVQSQRYELLDFERRCKISALGNLPNF
jgi:hypothetical protein